MFLKSFCKVFPGGRGNECSIWPPANWKRPDNRKEAIINYQCTTHCTLLAFLHPNVSTLHRVSLLCYTGSVMHYWLSPELQHTIGYCPQYAQVNACKLAVWKVHWLAVAATQVVGPVSNNLQWVSPRVTAKNTLTKTRWVRRGHTWSLAMIITYN